MPRLWELIHLKMTFQMSIFCSSTSTFYSLLSALFSHTTFPHVGTKAKIREKMVRVWKSKKLI